MAIYNIQPRVAVGGDVLIGTNGTGFAYYVQYRINKDSVINGVWAYVNCNAWGDLAWIGANIRSAGDTNLRASASTVAVSGIGAKWVYIPLSSPLAVTANTEYRIGVYGIDGADLRLEVQSNATAGHTHTVDPLTLTHVSAMFRDGIYNEYYQTYQDCSIGVQLEGTYNTQPPAPTHRMIFNTGYTINGKPMFFAEVSDPDSGNTIVNAQIQVSTNADMSSPYWDLQYGADSGYGSQWGGWAGLPTASNAPAIITWKNIPTGGDVPNGANYVRWRVKDNNGTWSSWSAIQLFYKVASPFTDTIPADALGFKASWLNDIATVIQNYNSFRLSWGVPPLLDGTLDTTKDMKPEHQMERRKIAETTYDALFPLIAWENKGDTLFQSVANMTQSTSGGVLTLTSTSADPQAYMVAGLKANPHIYRYLLVRYKVTAGTAGNMEAFCTTAYAPVFDGTIGISGNAVISDNQWRTVLIDLWTDADYRAKGDITGLRLDFATASGVTMQIDYVRLVRFDYFWSEPALNNLLHIDQATGGDHFGNLDKFSPWSANGQHTFTRDTTTYSTPYGSAKITSTSATAQDMVMGTYYFPAKVTPNSTVTIKITAKASAGKTIGISFWLWDKFGNRYENVGITTKTATGGWDELIGSYTIPSNRYAVQVDLYCLSANNGDSLWWDSAWLIEGVNPKQSLDRKGQHIIDLRNYMALI